jgi:hypothetical protein
MGESTRQKLRGAADNVHLYTAVVKMTSIFDSVAPARTREYHAAFRLYVSPKNHPHRYIRPIRELRLGEATDARL